MPLEFRKAPRFTKIPGHTVTLWRGNDKIGYVYAADCAWHAHYLYAKWGGDVRWTGLPSEMDAMSALLAHAKSIFKE